MTKSEPGVDMITVPLTTLAISEQLVNEAELRTLGEAVTLVGTVHEALNEAERCTWEPFAAGCLAAVASSEVATVWMMMELPLNVMGVEEGLLRIGGVGGVVIVADGLK